MKTIAFASVLLSSSALALPALGRRAEDDEPKFPISNGTIATPPGALGTGAAKPTGFVTSKIPAPAPTAAPTSSPETGCAPGTYRCAMGSSMGEGWEVCSLGTWTWAGACESSQVCNFNEQNGSPYCVPTGAEPIPDENNDDNIDEAGPGEETIEAPESQVPDLQEPETKLPEDGEPESGVKEPDSTGIDPEDSEDEFLKDEDTDGGSIEEDIDSDVTEASVIEARDVAVPIKKKVKQTRPHRVVPEVHVSLPTIKPDLGQLPRHTLA